MTEHAEPSGRGAPVARKRPPLTDLFITLLRRELAEPLQAFGKRSANRLRQVWPSRISGPAYVLNPFAAEARGEPLDRAGRPLPWRWKRSLSRDLLGQHGLILAGVAVVIAALA